MKTNKLFMLAILLACLTSQFIYSQTVNDIDVKPKASTISTVEKISNTVPDGIYADPLYSFEGPSTAIIAIDYDPVREGFWLATESQHTYLVDPFDGTVMLDIHLAGKVIGEDGNQTGVDVLASGNLLFSDYRGDLTNIDDYIFEFDPQTETLINYWPTSGIYNTSTDGSEVLDISGIAVGSDGFVYVTNNDDNKIYKLNLEPGSPGTWSTMATINAPGVSNVIGIDEFCGNWAITDNSSTTVAFLDASFLLNTTMDANHNSNSFNSGVCFREDSDPNQVAVTDYSSNHIGVFESGIIIVDFPVINSISGDTEICPDSETTLTIEGLLGSANDWYWYLDGCGNNLVHTGTPFTTPSLTENTTYFVRGAGGCVYNQPCQEITITVEDSEVPEITCPDPQSVSADPSQTYTVAGTDFDPVVNDNCEVTLVINDYNNAATLDGAIFPLGTTIVTWTAEDGSGNTNNCMFTVQVAENSNIGELESIGFKIFPNPSDGKFYVNHKVNTPFSLKITDIHGKDVIKKSSIEKRSLIDLSDQPKGLYIIKVLIDNNLYTGRLMVK